MYLVSAYFDQDSVQKLQNLINAVAEETGNDYMTRNNVPPHLTICAFEQKNTKKAIEIFQSFAGDLQSKTIYIPAIGAFCPNVIYAEVVQNPYLYDLSKKIYQNIKMFPDSKCSKYYMPLQWIPHVTIGKKLTPNQMSRAFEKLLELFHPFEAKIVKLGLSKPNPYIDLAEKYFI